MKKLILSFLLITMSLVVFSQEAADIEYLNQKRRENKYINFEKFNFVEFQSVIYSANRFIYKNYEVCALDRAYKQDVPSRPFKFKGETSYIVFRNIETNKFDIVVDLEPIFKKFENKEIQHKPVYDKNGKAVLNGKGERIAPPSIAIAMDGKMMFFSTATNTFAYNLENGTYEEIDMSDVNQPNIRYSLSNVDNIIIGNVILHFDVRKLLNGDVLTIENQFVEYNHSTKEFSCIH